jgi:hypothetical protein
MKLSTRIEKVLAKHGVKDADKKISRDLAEAVSRHRSLGFAGTTRKQRDSSSKAAQATQKA